MQKKQNACGLFIDIYKYEFSSWVKKFPYMMHFYINEENNTVEILAVISTDRNPKIWKEKSSKH